MDYLISQIWLCLAVAAVLGGIIGWLLRGDNKRKLLELENTWQDRYTSVEHENNALSHKVKDMDTLHHERNNLLIKVKDQQHKSEEITVERDGLLSRLGIMENGVKAAKKSLDDNKTQFQNRDSKLEELTLKLKKSEIQLVSVSKVNDERKTELSSVRTEQEDYKAQLISLKQDNHEVRAQLGDYKKNAESNKAIQAQLESDLEVMAGQLSKSESNLIEAQESLSHSESEMDNQVFKMKKLLDVETQIDTVSTQLSETESKLIQIQSERDEARTKLANFKAEHKDLSTTVEPIIKQLRDTELQLANSEKKLHELTEKSNGMSFRVTQSESKLDGYKADLLDADSKMSVIQGLLSESKDSSLNIEQSLDDKKGELKRLSSELSESELKLKRVISKLSDTEVTLQKKELEIQGYTQKINKVENNLADSKKEQRTSASKINSLLDTKSRVESVSSELADTEMKLKETHSRLSDAKLEIVNLSNLLSAQEQVRSASVSDSIKSAKNAEKAAKTKRNGLLKQLSESKDKLNAVEDNRNIQIVEYQKQLSELQANLDQRENQRDSDQDIQKDNEDQLNELKSKLENSESKIEQLTTVLSETETELKTATSQSAHFNKNNEKNNINIKNYEKQLSELQSSLDQSKGSNKDLQIENEDQLNELKSNLESSESKIEQLMTALSETETELKTATTQSVRFKKDNEKENINIKNYKKQLSELQLSLDQSKDFNKDLQKENQAQLSELKSKLESSESKIKKLTTTLLGAEAELQTAESQSDDYKKKLSDVKAGNDSREEVEKQVKQLEAKLADSESKVSNLTTQFSDSETKLKAKLETKFEEKLKVSSTENDGYKKNVLELQAALGSSNKKNEQLEVLKKNLAEVESKASSLSGRLSDAETNLKKKNSQVDGYKVQLKDLESNLDATRSKLSNAKSELGDSRQDTNSKHDNSLKPDDSRKPESSPKQGSSPKIAKLMGSTSEHTESGSLSDTLGVAEHSTQAEYEIEEIEGIGKGYGKQLNKLGITTTTDLLGKAANVSGVEAIAKDMGKQNWVVRSWSSMADLTRIEGVDGQFAELIEFSGVHSVQSLKKQSAKPFTETMKKVNDKEHRVKQAPETKSVEEWINAAKILPTVLDDDLEKIVPASETPGTSGIKQSEFSYEIEEIEGIGAGYGKQLGKLGIKTTTDLLAKGSNVSGVVSIAKDMNKQQWVVRSWSSMADLTRVEGVNGQFADLIEFSGVHSVQSLSRQNAKPFTETMKQVNDKEHRVKVAPETNAVTGWINYAKTLSPVLDDSLEKIVNTPAEDVSAKTVSKDTSSSNSSDFNYSDSSYEIEEIEGIGTGYGKQLTKMGISTTADLLKKYKADVSLSSVVESMKQEKWVVQSWVTMADLLRIDGVDGQYAELLYFSGIHSSQQLALFNPSNLTRKMERTNDEQHHVKVTPDVNSVVKWISIAKTLDKIVGF